MSAQCRHGLIRYECWQCRDEARQSSHVAQVFAGGLITATQQLEQRDDELRKLRALLRECLPEISGHLRDKVQQTLGSE